MYVKIGPYPGPRSKKERIVKVKIDKYDVWSMDHTLAYIITPMLKQLKVTKHGAPHTDDSDVPENLRSDKATLKENDYDTDSLWFDRWSWILDEMIWAFEQELDKDAEEQFYSGVSHQLWQALDKDNNKLGEPKEFGDKTKIKGTVFYQIVTASDDTFVYDGEAHQKYEERKRNGFRLFGRYYSCLWD